MKVPAVLTIYGVIFMYTLGVFSSLGRTDTRRKCEKDDLLNHWSCKHIIDIVYEPEINYYVFQIYLRSFRFPNADFLLYMESDRCSQLEGFGLHYVHMTRLPWQAMCFVTYADCASSRWNNNLDECNMFRLFLDYDLWYGLELTLVKDVIFHTPVLMSLYNGTELSFISETCSNTELIPTIPPAMKIVNIFYTNCKIDLLLKGKVMHKYYEDVLSNISVLNLTGSEKSVSILLEHLIRGNFCKQENRTCQMKSLVSLDISKSYQRVYTENSLNERDESMNTTVPVIKNLYARKVITISCNCFIKQYKYVYCIAVSYSKYMYEMHNDIICIKPETIELLDIAENRIEYIHTSMTNALTGLKVLDISENLLYSRNGGADINLGRMTALTHFYCSNNKLRTLSLGIFDTLPYLTDIDLSFNELTSINFRIEHLHHLRRLNLFKNQIKLSEPAILRQLTNLVMYQKAHFNTTVGLNLVENPVICPLACGTKDAVAWLLEHTKVIKFQPLLCDLNNNSRIINMFTLDFVEELCNRQLYVGIACLLGTLAATVIIVTTAIVYRHRLSLRRERRILKQIQNFKEDVRNDRFPVFLSFCSSNRDFVRKNIYDELNSRLQELLGISRRCVALGNADFRPGAMVIKEMIRCLSMCDVVIVCVSNDFLRSIWCTDEIWITHCLRKPIMLMFIEEADEKLLAKSILLLCFSRACRAKWVDGRLKLQPDWHVLCKSVVSHMGEHTAELDESETVV